MRKKGFTLIELLVVFGLLAALTIAAFIIVPAQLKKARDARRKADLDRIKTALYDYYFDHDCFPKQTDFPECGEDFGANGEVYLKDFPCDPSGAPYIYISKGGYSQWFRIFTNLEITTDPIIDKIHCRQGCGPSRNTCFYNYGVASTNTQIYRNCSFAYVCSPGGICQGFEDPWRSGCPMIFSDYESCVNSGLCSDDANRCKNDSGKQVPEE